MKFSNPTLMLRPWWTTALIFASGVSFAHAQVTSNVVDPVVEEADEYAPVRVSDPLERVNRVTFKFNEGAYRYVLRPIADGYVYVMPAPARRGIGNFFDNLKFPLRFVNSLLQGKPSQASRETGKFFVNTLGGLGGFIRQSDNIPALTQVPREDTGQTFGVWGIGKGPYLVLPLLGPGTVRDTVGAVGDYYLNPLNWHLLRNASDYDWTWETVPAVVDGVNTLPQVLRVYDVACKDALDPYVAVRSAYIQYRDAAVKQ
jgi:phospholipid-binding lipoprotein MlaA